MPEVPGVQPLLDFLLALPDAAAYALIAVGSAVENIFPPVPSDTFVVLGAVLVDRGSLEPAAVLLSAWVANTGGAMLVFGLARRHGPAVFRSRWGRRLLRPHQLRRMARFYERHGLWAIFFARFLPVLRVIVPTFAGFTGLGAVRALIPIVVASFLWNALMLSGGILASRNVHRIFELLSRVNAWLLVLAAAVLGLLVGWWVRSRRDDQEEPPAADHDAAGSESGPRRDTT
ncbi:DedA family protein [Candidatus Palauibacter sp.]|uniref:DedA family protein n=1 Tax=Candidatus Palauibacter sp. TaxID=3101350 RepID=UPI003B59EA7B